MSKFEKVYNLRASDFDKYDNLHISSVLDLFQDAAGIHSLNLGVSCKELMKRNLLWVVMRIKYEIYKTPEMYTDVLVSTWPLKPGHFDFERDYTICDTDGNLLIKGTSVWAIIDKDTRKTVPFGTVEYSTDNFVTERAFDGTRLKRIRLGEIDDQKQVYTVTAQYSDLDFNGHVNNTKYAKFIIDCLSPNEKLNMKAFQIDYHKEIMIGESISIYKTQTDEGKLVFAGKNEQSDTMFAAEIILSQ